MNKYIEYVPNMMLGASLLGMTGFISGSPAIIIAGMVTGAIIGFCVTLSISD